MYKLVIADDDGKTTIVPLVRDEVTIGRKEGNTIRLTERNVSRRHARLMKVNGHFTLEDLGSYNGVKVNGRKIDAQIDLAAGDQITIGDYSLAVQLEAAAQAAAEALALADAPTRATVPHAPSNGGEATALIEAPVAAPSPPRLVMLTQPAPGAEFALTRERLRLGRAEDLDVWVNHRSISREHAELIRTDHDIRITDLNSANGMRVNGREVKSASLEPGDILELGQVRFRVVGQGERFVFDAADTMRAGVLDAPPPRNSQPPLLAAIAIVAVAAAVAVAVAMIGDDGDSRRVAVQPTPPAAQRAFDQSLSACRAALASGEYAVAVEHGASALLVREHDPDATRCRDDAQQRVTDERNYREGVEALRTERIEDAYYALAQIPVDSPFRNRPEVTRAQIAYAEQNVTRAEAALGRGERAVARNAATNALAIELATPELRRRARVVLERLQHASVVANNTTPTPPATHAERTNHPDRPPVAASNNVTASNNSANTANPRTNPPPDRPRTNPPAANPPRDNPMTSCYRQSDYNQCVIDAFASGRHHSSAELQALILAFQAKDRTADRRTAMRTFVRQYPDDRRAPGYRQILEATGGI